MPPGKAAKKSAPKSAPAKARSDGASPPLKEQVQDALAWLERNGSKKFREDMVARYGIVTKDKTFGVSMSNIQKLAKELGQSHELAAALWDTGCYEARMLTAFVDDPARVTPAQMERWVKDFDNWAICDTLCFKLFDRTPHAWAMVAKWSEAKGEFVKRTAYALIASLALHDRDAADKTFLDSLRLIERAATDERNFVKKGVSWALRAIGTRRSPALKAAALKVTRRLADSPNATARWIGKDALRKLAK